MKQVQDRPRATVEVIIVFMLAIVLFQGIRASTFSAWELEILPGQRLFFLEYGAVLGVVLALFAITRRSGARYGIVLQGAREQMRVIAVGFLPVLALGGVLGMVNWQTWAGAGIVSAFAVGVLVVLGWALREKSPPGGIMSALVLVVLAPTAMEYGAVGSAILKTIYFYLLVGPAEEVLFRGYIQSRLNEVFGRPFRFFGVEWGWGLVMASVLFGLWHVASRPLDAGAWCHGLWTFFAGLIFGYVRERSRGIFAASVLHSVMNYLPLFDLLSV
ncbi:MAG: CPBP family intramembrane metalloprotease [Chloroflexi bacterium]|nr:CPBP family intramembrane metalloprotease [Chloroflexota bacterium]MBU1752164.1 CPBP family intramembrane metalloprotease [Chloroflexota bacterium]